MKSAVFAIAVAVAGMTAAAEWHHPLYLPGDGYWQQRIRVVVHNETQSELLGRPVAVPVGPGSDEIAIAGTPAEAVRLCTAAGVEMLFALAGPDRREIIAGPIPEGSTLAIPAECAAASSAVYYVYFDNASAGRVPDFLTARSGLVNGDVERGEDATPAGWYHDAADGQHVAAWSDQQPQSGKRCLKTIVEAGAEPTWIATRQHGIAITGGAKYRMRAWVKAENVKGEAGWYIHPGNRQDPMLTSPMLHGGGGSYDWKQLTVEFTAPADADRADVGTVLRGTGTAWFDNVTLQCLEPGAIRTETTPPQRLTLRTASRGVHPRAPWPKRNNDDGVIHRRAVAKTFNFLPTVINDALISIDLSAISARARGRLDRSSIRVLHGREPVNHTLLGNALLLDVDLPPRSVRTYSVEFSETTDPQQEDAPTPAEPARNLVANPSFEQGRPLPERWTHTGGDGTVFGLDATTAAGLGKRCAKMHVPHGAPEAWRGWQQNVPVRPGRTYLVGASIRGKDLRGDVLLHFHYLTADGALCKQDPMGSAGPPIRGTASLAAGGTTDWTRISSMLTMPDDAATLQLHLTMNTSGTVWHDGVTVVPVVPATIVAFECRPAEDSPRVDLWPVGAVEKVFPDDPSRAATAAEISLARNEQEPLQLAVRTGRARKNVRVEVDLPVGPDGATLDDVEVTVVGYVPIDHPTSYYRAETPEWHRKFPTRSGACDGWAGMWPDPLLPRSTFDLAANRTRAVWITFGTGKQTPPGDYRGAVRLVSGGKTIARQPLTVHVWDFTLPDENHVAAIYDVRMGPGGELWGKDLDAVYPEIVQFMARRRLSPDSIRPEPKIRYENGRVVADFTAFDKAADVYFNELKLPFAYTPWQFYLFGWAHPPRRNFGELPYPGDWPHDGADRSRLRPEYKRAYQACLKVFWDHLKEKGWDGRFVLYISDEPHDRHEHIRTQMKALCEMIHEVDPAIPIYSSTWKHVPDWDGSLDVWGIGHYGRVPVEQMAKLRAAGDRLWFTTDGQMCTDTPYCAVERLLPHYCFKYGVEAYEFWGVSWLTYDPYRFGWHAYIRQADQPGHYYWVRYPNGDGFLLYPGGPIGHQGPVSSIRLEQAREGVEDYEYLYMLRGLIDRAKITGRDTSEARRAMQRAAELVEIPNAGGRYSSKILPNPDAVFAARRAVARAIERLTE